MNAGEWVSWADCPDCGGLVAVGWLDGDPVAVDCAAGCPLRLEDVRIPANGRDRAGMLGDVAQMSAILKELVLDTAQAFGLADPRVAAALAAAAWADILDEEGWSPRLVELAISAAQEVGGRLHRRQLSTGPQDDPDASTDIRVLVVDHRPLARLRLIEMFAGEADLRVVGECENGSQVLEAAGRLRPHVVCVDRPVPSMDGLAATRALRAAEPGVRIVMLTAGSEARLEAALAGADALVPMQASRDALLRCLRTVASAGANCPYCL